MRGDGDDPVLAGPSHAEEPEASLQDVCPRGIVVDEGWRNHRRLWERTRVARLHEGNVPHGGVLEEVLGDPGLGVDEVDTLGVAGVGERCQQLQQVDERRAGGGPMVGLNVGSRTIAEEKGTGIQRDDLYGKGEASKTYAGIVGGNAHQHHLKHS